MTLPAPATSREAPSAPGLDPALAGYLARLGAEVARLTGGALDLASFRAASRAARLGLVVPGPPMAVEAMALAGLPARLYRPPGWEGRGALLYLHGGGWVMLDLDTHDHVLRALAARSGRAVVGLDYPLAPETRFPDTPRACADALAELGRRAPALGLGRIAMGGDSSGANLALAAAVVAREAGEAGPAALLLVYGVYDSDLHRPSYAAFGAPPYLLSSARMAFFWSQYCATEAHRADPLAAPLRLAPGRLAGLPPTLMVLAGQDVLLDENRQMAARLEAAGVAVATLTAEDAPHGFIEAAGLADVADAALARAGEWLADRLQ